MRMSKVDRRYLVQVRPALTPFHPLEDSLPRPTFGARESSPSWVARVTYGW